MSSSSGRPIVCNFSGLFPREQTSHPIHSPPHPSSHFANFGQSPQGQDGHQLFGQLPRLSLGDGREMVDDWFMEDMEDVSDNATVGHSVGHNAVVGQQSERTRRAAAKTSSFAAIAGMSPCMGVPPLDCFLFGGSKGTKPANQADNPVKKDAAASKRRKRHFSLEDYHDELLDESSSSSENSAFFQRQNSSGDQSAAGSSAEKAAVAGRKGSFGSQADQDQNDLNPLKYFIQDMSYDAGCGLHYLDDLVSAEFEERLVSAIAAQSADVEVVFPAGLLSVIAGHVLQEADDEPYGIKGCVVHIQYEGHSALHHLGTLDCDPGTGAKTFELTLTLRQGQATWGQRMARRLSFSSSTGPLPVSTSYKLVKKRTYRNNN